MVKFLKENFLESCSKQGWNIFLRSFHASKFNDFLIFRMFFFSFCHKMVIKNDEKFCKSVHRPVQVGHHWIKGPWSFNFDIKKSIEVGKNCGQSPSHDSYHLNFLASIYGWNKNKKWEFQPLQNHLTYWSKRVNIKNLLIWESAVRCCGLTPIN
jgi:hypothetical protein